MYTITRGQKYRKNTRRDLEVIRMLTKQQKHEQDMQRIREFRLFDDDFF